MKNFILSSVAVLAALLACSTSQAQVYSSMRTTAASDAPHGLFVEAVQAPSRSRVAGPVVIERIADFDTKVLCYRLQNTAALSCIPFTQLDPGVLSDLYQRAADAQR